MESREHIVLICTLLHIICEHLHDLYTLNSLRLRKFIPRDSLNSTLVYILFSLILHLYACSKNTLGAHDICKAGIKQGSALYNSFIQGKMSASRTIKKHFR